MFFCFPLYDLLYGAIVIDQISSNYIPYQSDNNSSTDERGFGGFTRCYCCRFGVSLLPRTNIVPWVLMGKTRASGEKCRFA